MKALNYMAHNPDRKIIQLARNMRSLTAKAVTLYGQEVNDIINSGCREKHRIEHTLDGMLDFCFDKSMLILYKKLCRYHYGVDRSSAAEYAFAYRKI